MTGQVLQTAAATTELTALLARGPSRPALLSVCGSTAPARLERVHFSDRRPLQLVYALGGQTVLAEFAGASCEAEAARLRHSLAKQRRGQAAALEDGAIVADPASGLVLRRPGLDARLPGLRMLHDPDAAREMVARIETRDPGPVAVTLMAHRLGKRAVLRLVGADGRTRYARLRTDKSASGATAFARHRALWEALQGSVLRIPEPLGQDEALAAALFAELPGTAPTFAGEDGFYASQAIGRGISALQGLPHHDLPRHDGKAEAQLLQDWLNRLRLHFPGRAEMLASVFPETCAALQTPAPFVPCHRDLHEKQLLVQAGRPGLLDFDTLCLGHPAMDAGNLMAHLFLMGLTAGRSCAAFETALVGAMRHVPLPQLMLWRKAALLRLCMIYIFSDIPPARLAALQAEALKSHD